MRNLTEQAPRHPRVILVERQPDPIELRQHVRAAGLIGYEKLALVADKFGRDVLVSLRFFDNRRSMNAGFGGKRAFADIRRMTIRRAIEQLIEPMGDANDAAERFVRNADVEFVGIFGLKLQRRDDRYEIGIAAALAQPVQRSLNLTGAGANRRKAVSHRLLGVVMGMDAD